MALNIGNLLAEEAHLATLSAPLSGAYTIEKMSNLLIEKSWNLLYELDSNDANAEPLIQKSIENARAIRLERFEQKQDTLIGVNSYKNEFAAPKATWGKIPESYGFPYIIFEKISSND
jgi:methylmalonyl-CoA mutase